MGCKKQGIREGNITSNINDIFNGLANQYGSKIQYNKGVPFFKSGNTSVHLTSSSNNIPTLRININKQLYKIRVRP